MEYDGPFDRLPAEIRSSIAEYLGPEERREFRLANRAARNVDRMTSYRMTPETISDLIRAIERGDSHLTVTVLKKYRGPMDVFFIHYLKQDINNEWPDQIRYNMENYSTQKQFTLSTGRVVNVANEDDLDLYIEHEIDRALSALAPHGECVLSTGVTVNMLDYEPDEFIVQLLAIEDIETLRKVLVWEMVRPNEGQIMPMIVDTFRGIEGGLENPYQSPTQTDMFYLLFKYLSMVNEKVLPYILEGMFRESIGRYTLRLIRRLIEDGVVDIQVYLHAFNRDNRLDALASIMDLVHFSSDPKDIRKEAAFGIPDLLEILRLYRGEDYTWLVRFLARSIAKYGWPDHPRGEANLKRLFDFLDERHLMPSFKDALSRSLLAASNIPFDFFDESSTSYF